MGHNKLEIFIYCLVNIAFVNVILKISNPSLMTKKI
jgi:hypothetical protein